MIEVIKKIEDAELRELARKLFDARECLRTGEYDKFAQIVDSLQPSPIAGPDDYSELDNPD